MTSLRELNTNEDLEFCMQTQAHISSQLARASELADALDARLVNFETQRESVLRDLADLTTSMNSAAERLTALDNLTGSHLDLVEKHQQIKVRFTLKRFIFVCLQFQLFLLRRDKFHV